MDYVSTADSAFSGHFTSLCQIPVGQTVTVTAGADYG